MTQWYVNELSKLTKVSVRTLHHYDKIGLLKPSVRLENGYRLYSEKDLLKLQQILALKFFGFELSRIKTLMQEEINIFHHFRAQQKFIEQKIQFLQKAHQTLGIILSESSNNTSVPWETIIKLIEDYNMTKELEHPWIANLLNSEELKEYAGFEQSLKTRYTEDQKKNHEQLWQNLVTQVEANLDKDPANDVGIRIGKECMDLVNSWYGKKHAALRTAIWERGYKQGQMEGEHGLSPQVVAWLDRAVSEYYRKRLLNILSQVGSAPSDAVLKLWNEVLEEMHGDEEAQNEALVDIALNDDQVSQAAKVWLKQIYTHHE